jgi:poly(A) polymerase
MKKISDAWLVNADTQAVMQALADAGYLAYFVGGSVRNTILGLPVSDIDIATSATPDEAAKAAQRVKLTVIPTGVEHGTITVLSGGIGHQVTSFRKDVITDGRHAQVAFSRSMEDDAKRRDFTMNAIYADAGGNLFDPVGGIADLLQGQVRFIEDADQRIREDYLRILRYFRFSAGFSAPENGFDPQVLAAIAKNIDGLDRLSAERITAEMLKLLESIDPAPALAAFSAVGGLNRILPGADTATIGVLVHLEAINDITPTAIRRLAAMGADLSRLKLSNKQSKHIAMIHDCLAKTEDLKSGTYRFGADVAMDAVLIGAASVGQDLPRDWKQQIDIGKKAKFPIRADDLMPKFQGKALGEKLQALEEVWIASGFQDASITGVGQ